MNFLELIVEFNSDEEIKMILKQNINLIVKVPFN